MSKSGLLDVPFTGEELTKIITDRVTDLWEQCLDDDYQAFEGLDLRDPTIPDPAEDDWFQTQVGKVLFDHAFGEVLDHHHKNRNREHEWRFAHFDPPEYVTLYEQQKTGK